MKTKIRFSLLLLLFSSYSFGQAPCESMLAWGVYDFSKTEIDEEQILNYAYWVDKKKFNSISELRSETSSFGLSIPDIIGLEFGSSGAVSYQKKSYSSFTELVKNNQEFRSHFLNQVKTINVNALKEYRLCIQAMDMYAWITVGELGKIAKLFIQINPRTNEGKVRIKKMIETNCSVKNKKDFIGKQLSGNPLPITLEIDSIDQDISVDILTNDPNYNASVTVWGRTQVPVPTCEDGLQNGSESGVDCGGTCSPCIKKYRVTVKTYRGEDTGTCEQVMLKLSGSLNDVSSRLGDSMKDYFQSGAKDIYIFDAEDIGNLSFMRIDLSNVKKCRGSKFDDWKVEYVMIENLTDKKSTEKITFKKPWLGDGDESKKYHQADVNWR